MLSVPRVWAPLYAWRQAGTLNLPSAFSGQSDNFCSHLGRFKSGVPDPPNFVAGGGVVEGKFEG